MLLRSLLRNPALGTPIQHVHVEADVYRATADALGELFNAADFKLMADLVSHLSALYPVHTDPTDELGLRFARHWHASAAGGRWDALAALILSFLSGLRALELTGLGLREADMESCGRAADRADHVEAFMVRAAHSQAAAAASAPGRATPPPLLPRCRDVRLAAKHGEEIVLDDAVAYLLPRVERFAVRAAAGRFERGIGAAQARLDVKSLALEDCAVDTDCLADLLAGAPALESLRFEHTGSPYADEIFEPPSLKRGLAACARTLRSLELGRGDWGDWGRLEMYGVEDVRLGPFAAFAVLRRLSLRLEFVVGLCAEPGEADEEVLGELGEGRYLPRSLEELEVVGEAEEGVLVRLVEELGGLVRRRRKVAPRLREVVLCLRDSGEARVFHEAHAGVLAEMTRVCEGEGVRFVYSELAARRRWD